MADETLIQWCDRTWSPWFGCRKVSPGCDNCYITRTPPYRIRGIVHGKRREGLSGAHWKLPARWNREAKRSGKSIKVFPSLCDPFDKEVPISWIADFVRVILDTPHLTWLLLTKRPQLIQSRMLDAAAWLNLQWDGFPENVWLGVSCENQEWADKRIPILLRTPAKVRFLSVEPMLGPIDLRLTYGVGVTQNANTIRAAEIHWVIVGGESGSGARPCGIGWVRSVVDQCAHAGIPVFVKQLGANPIAQFQRFPVKHSKGGDPSEWPKDLRVREFPTL